MRVLAEKTLGVRGGYTINARLVSYQTPTGKVTRPEIVLIGHSPDPVGWSLEDLQQLQVWLKQFADENMYFTTVK
jgi:hypothetical protein